MQFKSKTILEYISQLTEDRKEPISKLRNIINQNIDRGFSEEINYKYNKKEQISNKNFMYTYILN